MTEGPRQPPNTRRLALVVATEEEAAQWDEATTRLPASECVYVALSDEAHSYLARLGRELTGLLSGAHRRAVREQAIATSARVARRIEEDGALTVGDVNYGSLLYDRILSELRPLYELVGLLEHAISECGAATVAPLEATDDYAGAVMRECAAEEAARSLGIEALTPRRFSRRWARSASAAVWRAGQLARAWRDLRRRCREVAAPPDAPVAETFVVSPFKGAERATLAPIVEMLEKRRECRVVALESPEYHEPGGDLASPLEGLVYLPLDAFASPGGVSEARNVMSQVENALRNICDRADGGPLGRLGASEYVRGRLPLVIGIQAAHVHLSYAAALRAMRVLRPRAIIVAKCRGPHMEAVLGAASRSGVPTVFLPHGLYVHVPDWRPPNADLILSDGPAFEDLMRTAGTESGKVTRVGPPKYDAFLQRSGDRCADSPVDDVQLDPRKRHVCIAATGDVHATAEMARCLHEAVVEDDSLDLVVKLHPRLADESVQTRLSAAAPGVRLVLAGDSLALYSACDIVVTGGSTAGVEAMIAGTPVVYVGPLAHDVHGYVASEAAAHAATPAELPALIRRLLCSPRALRGLVARGRAYAETTFDPLDGRATERAIAAIERLPSV
ncbi:MAG: hypothetical protein ACE5O2_01410 [Armatimonadota bacterium]